SLIEGILIAVQVMQDLAIAQMVVALAETAASIITAGLSDIMAAGGVAEAIATQLEAIAEAGGARLLLKKAFEALTETLLTSLRNPKVLLDIGGAVVGGTNGLIFGITHHQSFPQILEGTATDAFLGFAVADNLSRNPVAAIETVAGAGAG